MQSTQPSPSYSPTALPISRARQIVDAADSAHVARLRELHEHQRRLNAEILGCRRQGTHYQRLVSERSRVERVIREMRAPVATEPTEREMLRAQLVLLQSRLRGLESGTVAHARTCRAIDQAIRALREVV